MPRAFVGEKETGNFFWTVDVVSTKHAPKYEVTGNEATTSSGSAVGQGRIRELCSDLSAT